MHHPTSFFYQLRDSSANRLIMQVRYAPMCWREKSGIASDGEFTRIPCFVNRPFGSPTARKIAEQRRFLPGFDSPPLHSR